jgi:CelD/BcsL family acetyltransferase involved in cellulose biosynthesis
MTNLARIARGRGEADIAFASIASGSHLLDALSRAAPPEHHFLRAAWYEASGAETVLLALVDGTPVAAFPTVAAGPAALGARAVAGLYWPFRNILLAADADDGDVTRILAALRTGNRLGPLWRLGPVYADDPTAARLARLAPEAGWAVLKRPLGRSWVMEANEAGTRFGTWPRSSTLKRLAGYERALRASGTLEIERIVGSAWTPEVLDALAEVERASWIAASTDHSGAKFMLPSRRAFWGRCIADPALAQMLSAVLVRLDGRPIGFSVDLTVGTVQYGIAGTYDEAFGALNVGKLANERNLIWALERGVRRVDWGAGDSGYKRTVGFEPGPEIIDLLFVRNSVAAAALRRRWEKQGEAKPDEPRTLPLSGRQALLVASLATAAAVAAASE